MTDGCDLPARIRGWAGSDPALAAEDQVQRSPTARRSPPSRPMNPDQWPKPGYGHVLAVEAGDRGRDGDDRGPAGDLLHDHVQPVALDRQVGLEDRGDQVAQRLGPLGGPQDVVVDVLVVRAPSPRRRRAGRGASACSRPRASAARPGAAAPGSCAARTSGAAPPARAARRRRAGPRAPRSASSRDCTASKWPSTTSSSSPCSRNATPCLARSGESSQRATTPSMSKSCRLRTVTSAWCVTNADDLGRGRAGRERCPASSGVGGDEQVRRRSGRAWAAGARSRRPRPRGGAG